MTKGHRTGSTAATTPRVCGPSATGKSHVCEALRQPATDSNRTVAWFGVDEPGALIRRHRAHDSITTTIRRITRIAIRSPADDIGILPVGETVDSAPPLDRGSAG